MGKRTRTTRHGATRPLSAGFTLIELLTVIGILGVLASGLLVIINPLAQLQKARDAQRKSDLGQIQKALEVYYQDTNAYPATGALGSLAPQYIQTVPTDKVTTQSYYYVSTGQSYQLYARLEAPGDPQICTGKCIGLTNNCGTNVACNYGVSSTNTTP